MKKATINLHPVPPPKIKVREIRDTPKDQNVVALVYIGDKFYLESGSTMSPIYTEDGNRYHFGFVQRDLSQGKTVTIRQATDAEFRHYDEKLQQCKREWDALGFRKGQA